MLEETMPGISCMAIDVLTDDGSHPHKAGPCAGCNGSSEFLRLQNKLAGMPERLAAGQGSRGGYRQQGDDSRSTGLPGMSGLNTEESIAPEIERQAMEVDIACAGFGPAMGGFLTTLTRTLDRASHRSRLRKQGAPGMPLQVLCYERADDIASGVSGVVTAEGHSRQLP
jgi:hypothetical protein